MPDDAIGGGIVGCLCGLLLGGFVGASICDGMWRRDAVAHGTARYVIEGDHYNVKWVQPLPVDGEKNNP